MKNSVCRLPKLLDSVSIAIRHIESIEPVHTSDKDKITLLITTVSGACHFSAPLPCDVAEKFIKDLEYAIERLNNDTKQ